MDLALNNLQGLICHETQLTQPLINIITNAESQYSKPLNSMQANEKYEIEFLLFDWHI